MKALWLILLIVTTSILLFCTPQVKYKPVQGIGYGSGYGKSKKNKTDVNNSNNLNNTSSKSRNPISDDSNKRSKAAIMRVIMQKLKTIHDAYNKRLTEDSSVWGALTIKFFIINTGEVINAKIVKNRLYDPILENQIVNIFNSIQFEHTDNIDTIEFIHPLFLSTAKHDLNDLNIREIDRNKKGPRNSEHIYKKIKKLENELHLLYCGSAEASKGVIACSIEIATNGKVNQVTILNSTLNNNVLEHIFTEHIKQFDFKNDNSSDSPTSVPWIFHFNKETLICP